jgi:hypothetical protein
LFRRPGPPLNIDFGIIDTDPATLGTDVNLVDISETSGIDLSGLDDTYYNWVYDDPSDAAYGTIETDGDWNTWEPIVIYMNGDGTAIIAINDSTVYFNLDSDAYPRVINLT